MKLNKKLSLLSIILALNTNAMKKGFLISGPKSNKAIEAQCKTRIAQTNTDDPPKESRNLNYEDIAFFLRRIPGFSEIEKKSSFDVNIERDTKYLQEFRKPNLAFEKLTQKEIKFIVDIIRKNEKTKGMALKGEDLVKFINALNNFKFPQEVCCDPVGEYSYILFDIQDYLIPMDESKKEFHEISDILHKLNILFFKSAGKHEELIIGETGRLYSENLFNIFYLCLSNKIIIFPIANRKQNLEIYHAIHERSFAVHSGISLYRGGGIIFQAMSLQNQAMEQLILIRGIDNENIECSFIIDNRIVIQGENRISSKLYNLLGRPVENSEFFPLPKNEEDLELMQIALLSKAKQARYNIKKDEDRVNYIKTMQLFLEDGLFEGKSDEEAIAIIDKKIEEGEAAFKKRAEEDAFENLSNHEGFQKMSKFLAEKEEENKNLEKRILERETKKLNQAAGAKDRKARKISSERKGERIENESLEKIEELNLRKQQADNLLIHQKIKEKQEAEIKKEVERILDEKKRSSTKFHDIAQIIFTYFDKNGGSISSDPSKHHVFKLKGGGSASLTRPHGGKEIRSDKEIVRRATTAITEMLGLNIILQTNIP